MNGFGPPPQAPDGRRPLRIALLVIFAALPLVSLGLLSWATMLRLASVTGRRLHWFLCALSALVVAGCFGVILSDPTEELTRTRSDVSIIVLLVAAVAVLGYFLYAEITYFSALGARAPGHGPATGPVQGGYGHPGWAVAPTVPVAPPFTAGPVPPYRSGPPQPPHGVPSFGPPAPMPSPAPSTPATPSPVPMPMPTPDPFAPPASAVSSPADLRQRAEQPRIQQVRAELDDLSDLLRNRRDDR
ncbi:hypothetical protein [Streptomyces corynorhini]|uniref:Uncharacterized protein n=1 Tax=Streptomyces corynorhini TaxID=2282652 RepID=A0A370B913_9ACTN|nr:hypothetical protein [Streptomyces corynorhini]RDG36869.1 hypothetical protein DVH02_17595 [Streptomyces corynorhini]